MEDGTPLSGQQTNKPAFQISPRILVSLQNAPEKKTSSKNGKVLFYRI
jgi:hypothetical protein